MLPNPLDSVDESGPAEPARGPLGGTVKRRSLTRAGLGAGLAVGISLPMVTGCEAPAARPGVRRTVRSDDVLPDVALAATALRAITLERQVLAGVVVGYPRLRTTLAPLTRVLEAHQRMLREAVPSPAPSRPRPSEPTPPDRDAAVRSTGRRAIALADRLGTFAVEAESGAFAQLLASMSAGLTQQTAALELAS